MLAVVPLLFIAVPQPARRPNNGAAGHFHSILLDVREALRYLRGWPALLLVGLMAVVFNVAFQPAVALMPILVSKYFGGDAMHLGWIESAFGLGAVAGGLTLSVWGGFRRRVLTSLSGLIGLGLASMVVGLTPPWAFSWAVGVTFAAGFMMPLAYGPLMASMQALVAPEMQGRVFNIMSSGALAAAPIGLLIAGPIADLFGANTWFVVGGLACMTMAIAALFMPAVMHIEEDERVRAAHEVPEAGE